jgi:hypothetical protein
VDTGLTPSRWFARSGDPGDWQVWAINFNEPFLAPPAVFVCATDWFNNTGSYTRAAVGTVFDPTTDGFTLAARNSDVSAGPARFFWLAVGRAA